MKFYKFRWSNNRISLFWPDHPLLMAGDKYIERVVDLLINKNPVQDIILNLSKISEFNIYEITEFVNLIKDAIEESGVIKDQSTISPIDVIPGHLQLAMATFNLTRKCNLKCNHCYAEGNSDRHKNELSVNDLPDFISNLSNLITRPPRLFIISGGEPTLERNKLILAVKEARKNRLNIRLNTNGHFIDETLALFLADNNVLVQVSLDGADKKTHALLRVKEDSFDIAVEAIKMLVEAGCRTRISCTVHSENFIQLPIMIKFAQQLRVEQFTTSSLVGLGNALKNNIKPVDFSKEFLILYNLVKNDKAKQSLTRSTLLAETIIAIRAGVKFTYCGTGCCTCCVDSDGKLYPCINMVRDEFCAGDIMSLDLSDLWKNSKILNDIRALNVDSINKKCAQCIFRYFCGGYCRGETIASGKGIKAPYARCSSWKRGLINIMNFLSETPDLYDFEVDPLLGVLHRE